MPSRKHLTFDKAAFMRHMLKAYEAQLLSLAEQICRKMKGSILNMEGKGLAMRDTWIRMVARSIGYRALRVDTPFGDEPWMIQVKLGPWQGSNARYSIKENTRTRALVVMYGTGTKAVVPGVTLKHKPGQTVWDKGIFDQHTSRSKHPERVVAPIKGTSISSFDTRGGNYIAKYMQAAVKVMQRIMKETMVDININDFLVYK